MTKKTLLFIVFLFFFLDDTFSQNNTSGAKINGRIISEKKLPVANANIRLISLFDSTVVKDIRSDSSGRFHFYNTFKNDYLLRVSYVGFNIRELKIKIDNDKTVDLGDIYIERNVMLETVIVNDKKNQIDYKLGKILVNVADGPLSNGYDLLDVLRASPGVTIDEKGVITLNGKTGVSIMINNKLTYLSGEQLIAYLKSLRAEEINQLELISNPSSKYDAAGASIINVKLKKSKKQGLNGSTYLNYTQAKFHQVNGGLTINHNTDKLTTTASYNFNRGRNWNSQSATQKYYDISSNELITTQDRQTYGLFKLMNQNFRISMDYQLNRKNLLGISVNGIFNNTETVAFEGFTNFRNNEGKLDSSTYSNNTGEAKFQNVIYNLNYTLLLDSIGQNLSLGATHARVNNPSSQDFVSKFYGQDGNMKIRPDEIRIGRIPVDVRISTVTADYAKNIKDKGKFEAGVKASWVNTENNIQYRLLMGDEYILDERFSNYFIYKENIFSEYLNYNHILGSGWEIQIGIRGELTVSEANQLSIDSLTSRKYFQLFPSGILQKKIDDNNIISISYSRRINRPNYQRLNPFTYFVDQYNYSTGNPYLQPELANSYSVGHLFKNKIYSELNYTVTDNVINNVFYQDDSLKRTISTVENLSKLRHLGLSINFPLVLAKWWNSNNSFSLYTNRYLGSINSNPLNADQLTFSFNTTNVFKLPFSVDGNIMSSYFSKTRFGAIVMDPIFTTSIGLQRRFFDDDLLIKLNVNDVFHSYKTRTYQIFGNIDSQYLAKQQTRWFNLSVSFNFGNEKVKAVKAKKSGIDTESSRVN